jgi:hypothetical protein
MSQTPKIAVLIETRKQTSLLVIALGVTPTKRLKLRLSKSG